MEDPKKHRAIMAQLDGEPKQQVRATGGNGGPIQIEQVEISFKERRLGVAIG
jgi:hypothetical protein